MPLAVELEDVSFAYRRGQPVLTDVDLAIEEGEFVAIAGPNGGGKTTLVRLVLGLERPASGTARLFGEPAHRFSRRATLGYLAQRSQLGATRPVTVREVVARRPARRGGLLGPLRAPGPRDRRRRDRPTSGSPAWRTRRSPALGRPAAACVHREGARRRAVAARARRADRGRRRESQEALAALLERLHATSDVTILYVSHEFGAVERIVERLVLVRGGIVFDGPPGDLPSYGTTRRTPMFE